MPRILSTSSMTVRVIFSIIILLLLPSRGYADMMYSARSESNPGDTRHIYGNELVRLALDKTIDEYGPYRIQTTPSMSFARAIESVKSNKYPNFFFGTPYDKKLLEGGNVEAIEFPIVLGLLGYRVCFYPIRQKNPVTTHLQSGEFKNLIHGQGASWIDVDILRHNGYRVYEVASYDSLFKMTAAGRFDLFCRGANEVYDEYLKHKDRPGLAFDHTFSFHYPMPVFFLMNSADQRAIERLKKGLTKSYEDGSMQKLLLSHYGDSLDFIQLHNRKIITLENPFLEGLDPSWSNYSLPGK